jgi:hypothetical protein
MTNNENYYYSKYLKYKNKYLDLKQLMGGGLEKDKENELEKKKTKEDVLKKSIGAALYINSFELLNKEPYCAYNLEKMEPQTFKKIIQFNNINVINGSKYELEQFKEKHHDWRNTTFGEVNKLYKTDIDEYCNLYQNEVKSDLDEGSGLFGDFDDKQIREKIEVDLKDEDEENNVVNLFSE